MQRTHDDAQDYIQHLEAALAEKDEQMEAKDLEITKLQLALTEANNRVFTMNGQLSTLTQDLEQLRAESAQWEKASLVKLIEERDQLREELERVKAARDLNWTFFEQERAYRKQDQHSHADLLVEAKWAMEQTLHYMTLAGFTKDSDSIKRAQAFLRTQEPARTQCSVSFAHPAHDFCKGIPFDNRTQEGT